MSVYTGQKPSLFIKHVRCAHYPPDHRRQSAADRSRRYSLLQFMLQSRLGKHLEGSETVADRTPHHRVGAFRPNHTLQYGCIPGSARNYRSAHSLDLRAFIRKELHQIHIHRLNHKTVVIITVKHGPVAINPVPLIPSLESSQRIKHPHQIVGLP